MYWTHACAGIAEIHAKGYLYRDIKPGNMLIFNDKLLINDFDGTCKKNAV